MKNMKIGARLVALIGLLSALLVAIGALGLWGIGKANESTRGIYEESLLANRLAIAVALITPDAPTIAAAAQTLEENIAAITAHDHTAGQLCWPPALPHTARISKTASSKPCTSNSCSTRACQS